MNVSVQKLEPRPSDVLGVTKECPCGTSFESHSPRHRFCSGSCRQWSYRQSSPAHRARLDGLKIQRLNRRNDQVRRRNKFKSLSFDGVHSGPLDTTVPSVGQLNLKQYSKV